MWATNRGFFFVNKFNCYNNQSFHKSNTSGSVFVLKMQNSRQAKDGRNGQIKSENSWNCFIWFDLNLKIKSTNKRYNQPSIHGIIAIPCKERYKPSETICTMILYFHLERVCLCLCWCIRARLAKKIYVELVNKKEKWCMLCMSMVSHD